MPAPTPTVVRQVPNPTSTMSFAVALCAFAAAGIGVLVNQWMSGLMAVGGMAGIGLLYLAIGVLNLKTTSEPELENDDVAETSAHRLSHVANVDHLPAERSQECISSSATAN